MSAVVDRADENTAAALTKCTATAATPATLPHAGRSCAFASPPADDDGRRHPALMIAARSYRADVVGGEEDRGGDAARRPRSARRGGAP
jgi:hypothetical protein